MADSEALDLLTKLFELLPPWDLLKGLMRLNLQRPTQQDVLGPFCKDGKADWQVNGSPPPPSAWLPSIQDGRYQPDLEAWRAALQAADFGNLTDSAARVVPGARVTPSDLGSLDVTRLTESLRQVRPMLSSGWFEGTLDGTSVDAATFETALDNLVSSITSTMAGA